MLGFQTNKTKAKKTHIKNLLAVMAADGEIQDSEMRALGLIAKRVGITPKGLQKIVSKPEKIKFVVPKDDKERFQQLYDIVFMMTIDGQIDQREMDFCITVAGRLGYPPSKVRQMVLTILKAMQRGDDRHVVSIEVAKFLVGR